VFNAASKLYFTIAGIAIVAGFGYALASSDRVGFTSLVLAGFGALALAITAYAFVPREPVAALVDEPADARPADTTDVAIGSRGPLLVAASITFVVAGLATDRALLVFGLVVGVIGALGWV